MSYSRSCKYPIAVFVLALLPTLPVAKVGAQQLEEVLVTARKRTENLQRAPLSITAITAATIEDAKLLSEKLRLNVAARYTYVEKELDTFTLKRASQTPIALPGPTTPSQCGDVIPSGNGSFFSCEEDWNEFSPKIGLDYQFSDNVMGYAHVSRGFRSGASNGRPISTQEISVADPETVTSYEIGFKSQLWDRRWSVLGLNERAST